METIENVIIIIMYLKKKSQSRYFNGTIHFEIHL
jgi:hypothetical protein